MGGKAPPPLRTPLMGGDTLFGGLVIEGGRYMGRSEIGSDKILAVSINVQVKCV